LGLEFDEDLNLFFIELDSNPRLHHDYMPLQGFDGRMLHPFPLKEISTRDLEQWGNTKEVSCASLRREKLWILRMEKFLDLRSRLLLKMAAPLNFKELNHSMPRDSVLLIQNLHWMLWIRQVGIDG
jgi:hypothetical protein